MGIVQSFVLLAAVIIVVAAFAYAQRLRHQRTLRTTEMVHEERMAAINQGMELPTARSGALRGVSRADRLQSWASRSKARTNASCATSSASAANRGPSTPAAT